MEVILISEIVFLFLFGFVAFDPEYLSSFVGLLFVYTFSGFLAEGTETKKMIKRKTTGKVKRSEKDRETIP